MSEWLTAKEQREIIFYVRSHAPKVLEEASEILKQVLALLNLFTTQRRLDFAQHFVPEVEILGKCQKVSS